MSIAGDHLAESEYWKERALRAEAKLARPEARAIPAKRESILLTVGDDSIIYLQLMNFEDGERVEVMVTPASPTPQNGST